MTSWTARIDALPPIVTLEVQLEETGDWEHMEAPWPLRCRLALAAERMKEPHNWQCALYGERGPCTCGKDADMARILEGR